MKIHIKKTVLSFQNLAKRNSLVKKEALNILSHYVSCAVGKGEKRLCRIYHNSSCNEDEAT